MAHTETVRWMLYLDTFAMNLSWPLHHLNEKSSQEWLMVAVLIPIVLLVALIVSVIGFIRIVQLDVRYVRHLLRPSDSGLKSVTLPVDDNLRDRADCLRMDTRPPLQDDGSILEYSCW